MSLSLYVNSMSIGSSTPWHQPPPNKFEGLRQQVAIDRGELLQAYVADEGLISADKTLLYCGSVGRLVTAYAFGRPLHVAEGPTQVDEEAVVATQRATDVLGSVLGNEQQERRSGLSDRYEHAVRSTLPFWRRILPITLEHDPAEALIQAAAEEGRQFEGYLGQPGPEDLLRYYVGRVMSDYNDPFMGTGDLRQVTTRLLAPQLSLEQEIITASLGSLPGYMG